MKKKLLKGIYMLSKYFLYGFVIQLLFLNFSLVVNAKGQYKSIEEVNIRISNDQLSIGQFFKEVQRQTPFKFSYDSKKVGRLTMLSFEKTRGSVEDFLIEVSKQSALSFRQYNNSIDVKMDEEALVTVVPAKEDPVRVTGTVTDENGEPIPGVTVSVPGTNSGVATDLGGRYSLSVEEGSTLVFSFIGFETQTIAVGERSVIDVTLSEDMASLDEVVVVGYGTQRKANLTGSVSTLKFDRDLGNRPITSAAQALGGQMPGVWVSEVSGQPGENDGVRLRVRGWGTLNSAGPMVLIDGVEGSLAQISPKDIESMTVLKDAASASIYGSKAANGVVLITTKSGNYNQKTKINLSTYAGVQSIARKFDIIDNSVEYMEMWNQAVVNGGSSSLFPDPLIEDFRNNSDLYLYPNTNYFDEVYRSALISEHNLSLSGGSEKTKYMVSLNGLQHDGIMRQTGSTRYGLNLNVESKLKDWLTIGARINSLHKKSKEPYSISEVTYMSVHGAYPFMPPYNADGTFGAPQALGSNGELLVPQRNPLLEIYNGLTESEYYFTKQNVFADIKINNYLNFNTNFSVQATNMVTDRYNDIMMGYTSTGVEAGNHAQYTLSASRSNSNGITYLWFNTLNFHKNFGDKHDVSAIAGFQTESLKNKSAYSRRTDPPIAGLTQVDAGTSGVVAEGNMVAFRMLSYFGRINYAFADKYLFEVNTRADASSRFAQANRWGVFPGVSAGWRIGAESFMENQRIFSELKLRGSWGKLGNQDIVGYWPYLTTITQDFNTSYNFNGSLAPGAAATVLTDESITWEMTTSTDVGLEMGLLDDRLFIEAIYFSKETNNIIVQLPIPLTLGGVGSPYENVGKMSNKGIELDVRFSKAAIDRNSLSYSLGGNFTYVTNKVTKFMGGTSPDQLYLIREGYSYRTLYTFQAEGIYQTDQEALEHMHANAYKPQAGDLRFTDINVDGRLDFNDYTGIGNTIPKYNFGASLNFSYKGFDLGVLMQGVAGVHMVTNSAWTQPFGVSGGTVTKRWRDAWSPENTDTNIPMLKMPDTWNRQNSSFWIANASFLKVKNIQLGYSFPENAMERLRMNNLYLFVNAQNALTFADKDYEGFDPERNTHSNGESTYPLAKVFSLGLNTSF